MAAILPHVIFVSESRHRRGLKNGNGKGTDTDTERVGEPDQKMPGMFFQPSHGYNGLPLVPSAGKTVGKQAWICEKTDQLVCLSDVLCIMVGAWILHLVGVFQIVSG